MNILNKTWQQQVQNWEYTSAATPDLNAIDFQSFPASLHQTDETMIIPLDTSSNLGVAYLASSPNLLANYIHIAKGDTLQTDVESSSEVFYIMRGSGQSFVDEGVIQWQTGDVFTMPCNQGIRHEASSDTVIFWTHDAPLLSYLGVQAQQARFKPAFYDHQDLLDEVHAVKDIAVQENRNRAGIILGNLDSVSTKSITHDMWSLLNILPANCVQKPHRHNSVALDLAISAAENTYTLMGKEIDDDGNIVNPIRADWASNSVFITPPSWWHSHHNESNQDAYVFPVQDAGLYTYMRTLDIQFVR
ncbi:MAG: hypothetical protein Q9M18_03735 [Mariprofundaceae bacterium]|nr:hypothetical protein [Mariprofundaceae bacterium]